MATKKDKPKAFSVYLDSFKHVKLLDMQERGELLTALYEYAVFDKVPDFENGKLQMALSFFCAQIDRDFEKYFATCEKNRAIAKNRKTRTKKDQPSPVVTSGNQYKEENKKENKKENKNKKEIIVSAPADERTRFDYQSVVDSFNSVCVSLPKVKKLTDKRREAIRKATLLLDDLSFENCFALVEQSDFLTGRSGDDWRANFDWVLEENHLVKIVEGCYISESDKAPNNTTNKREGSEVDWVEYED